MSVAPLAVLVVLVATQVYAVNIIDGVVPGKLVPRIEAYLGDYEGQWNTEVTENIYDDISRYVLEAPVLRLSLDNVDRLVVKFFMDREAARAGDELDLLGFACLSRVGDLLALKLPRASGKAPAETYSALEASFDFVWGRCPARLHAVDSNDLLVVLAVNPIDHEYVLKASLLRKVQADNTVYAKRDGAYYEVKPRRADRNPDSVRPPRLEFCVENVDGEPEGCFQRESEVKRFIIPFPLGSLSAAWYTKKAPLIKVEKGMKLIYHEAVFRRRFDEAP